MSGFPINLDISEYFDDLRKYASIFINLSKFKDVRDVENHIKAVFGLEDNICLLYKKFLIPRSEDIQILHQYDIFKVQKCNFYDLQIHKTKKVNNNSTCDQKALNLTQSEKTIDLSCRPKQRLKANVCPSPGVSGSQSLHFDHKRCTDSQVMSPEHNVLVNGNHNVSKDKPKNKKKKYLRSDESDDADNILDMSVKNSRRKKHSNCFSTDDGSLLSDAVNDVCHKDISKNPSKKSKKRKKNSECVDESADLANTCWMSLICNDVSSKDQHVKRKSKRSLENSLNDSLSSDVNKSSTKNAPGSAIDFDNNHAVDDECPAKKRHKHKKHEESKGLLVSKENQYYPSSPSCASENQKKTINFRTFCDNNRHEKSFDSNTLEEQKQRIKVEIDRRLSEMHKNSSDSNTGSLNDLSGDKSVVSSKPPSLDTDFLENCEGSGDKNVAQESSSMDLDYTNNRIKRKRKHNKKKKKREKLLYMLAVGPTVSQLTTQPSDSVVKSFPSGDIAKHVYFTEEDFAEDMTVPTTPLNRSQTKTGSSQHLNSLDDGATPQEQESSKPATWQDQLLQLASSTSKPVVFHRNTSVASNSKPSLSPRHCIAGSNSSETNGSTSDRPVQVDSVVEKNDNNNEDQNSSSGNVDGFSSRKGLPDICKPLPIPNDLQNINLSDYPIIDKVVPKDFILFKVWKLSEAGEPGISKPILARVNESSNSPDKISLQIMEGCDECSHCTQAEDSDLPFTIELQWSDILEPRLFYP